MKSIEQLVANLMHECMSYEQNGEDVEEARDALLAAVAALTGKKAKTTITLPREMDDDLHYIVGRAMGVAAGPCKEAYLLWQHLVDRANADATAAPTGERK